MGNSRPLEKKRKKKGRPSLLDLQKRSLRLQKQQHQNPNPSPSPDPNPYLRFPAGRPTRRNPADDDEDDSSSAGGKRREKKLKLVLRIPDNSASDPASSASDSDGAARRKRRIDAVSADRVKAEECGSPSKATDAPQGDPSEPGPTTPLPDRKLLEFILDRVQKKDTYGVFSEPVDPDELPDYHDIIKDPMDFGTVRMKLSSGAYVNLEQFEKDVFLISSNGMRYNAPDTIYFRQARAIQELAKKNFENLRQESDDNEPEPKTARRGRPPNKNAIKRTVGRLSAERDFSSDATLANAGDNSHWNLTQDLSRKGLILDRLSTVGISTRTPHGLRNTETYSWINEHKERNEEYSGSLGKVSIKNGKKISVTDENRRCTYNLPQLSDCVQEPSVLTTFDGEKKLLVPVGLHAEYAYARSLARFAAKLGPAGWEIAAKRIERVLPPGIKFGRGWVGDEAPQKYQQPLFSTSAPHSSSQPRTPYCITLKAEKNPDNQEVPGSILTVEGAPSNSLVPTSASAYAVPSRSSDPVENAQLVRGSIHGGFSTPSGTGGTRPKISFQLQQNSAMQPTLNGFNTTCGNNLLSHVEKLVRPVRPTPGSFGTDATVMTHSRVLDMVSRSNSSAVHQSPVSKVEANEAKLTCNPSAVNSGSPSVDPARDSQGQWRSLSLNIKPGAVPPDLNVGFQSPGSPVSGVLVDSPHPDLALQL